MQMEWKKKHVILVTFLRLQKVCHGTFLCMKSQFPHPWQVKSYNFIHRTKKKLNFAVQWICFENFWQNGNLYSTISFSIFLYICLFLPPLPLFLFFVSHPHILGTCCRQFYRSQLIRSNTIKPPYCEVLVPPERLHSFFRDLWANII